MALLRGINVGGRSSVSMAALRAEMAGPGFEDVVPYIQSGNVVFGSAAGEAGVVEMVEDSLSTRFERPIRVLLRSAAEPAAVARAHPLAGDQDGTT